MSKRIDLVGRVFGRLTVIGVSIKRGNQNQIHWDCKCVCGKITSVNSPNLRKGHTTSCGCYRNESKIGSCGKIRGNEIELGYNSFSTMLQRCYNPLNDRYYDYGGRGTKVCQMYKQGFISFLNDVGSRPSPKHSIDRIDNDGNYSCGHCEECIKNGWKRNVRWGTRKQQAGNRRDTAWLEYGGLRMNKEDWARSLNTTATMLNFHLRKNRNMEQIISWYRFKADGLTYKWFS